MTPVPARVSTSQEGAQLTTMSVTGGQLKIFLKTRGDPLAMVPAARTALRDVDPQLRLRRIAILMGSAETALDQISVATFVARLDELGWKSGRNLRTDVRWWSGTPEQMRGVIADMLRRVRSRCAPEYQDFVREVSFAGPGEAIDFVDALAACTRLVAVAWRGHEQEDDPGSMWCIALHGSH